MTETQSRTQVYTVSEVAELLRCDKSSVYRLIKKDGIKVVRVGTSFRITEAALTAFMLGEAVG